MEEDIPSASSLLSRTLHDQRKKVQKALLERGPECDRRQKTLEKWEYIPRRVTREKSSEPPSQALENDIPQPSSMVSLTLPEKRTNVQKALLEKTLGALESREPGLFNHERGTHSCAN